MLHALPLVFALSVERLDANRHCVLHALPLVFLIRSFTGSRVWVKVIVGVQVLGFWVKVSVGVLVLGFWVKVSVGVHCFGFWFLGFVG